MATVGNLAAEFARLDREAAECYEGRERSDRWPWVAFNAGNGTGHAVVSVHPDDMDKAVEVMRRYEDGAANVSGPESWAYDPRKAFAAAGVRCEWHV